jgi:hypothetical protein
MTVNENRNRIWAAIEMLSAAIDNSFRELRAQLNETHEELMVKLAGRNDESNEVKNVDNLSLKTASVEVYFESIEHRLQQQRDKSLRINNLLLNGVPFVEGENLKRVFGAIAAKVGFSTPPDIDIFRFPGPSFSQRSILMKFPTEFNKEQFFDKYFKVSNELKLATIPGFEWSTDRLYIHHDLVKEQYELFKAAMRKKKEGRVEQVRVKRGEVMVKIKNSNVFRSFPNVSDFLKRFNLPDAA